MSICSCTNCILSILEFQETYTHNKTYFFLNATCIYRILNSYSPTDFYYSYYRHFELEKTIAESVSTMASKKSSVTIYIGGVTLVRSVSTKCREQKVSPRLKSHILKWINPHYKPKQKQSKTAFRIL